MPPTSAVPMPFSTHACTALQAVGCGSRHRGPRLLQAPAKHSGAALAVDWLCGLARAGALAHVQRVLAVLPVHSDRPMSSWDCSQEKCSCSAMLATRYASSIPCYWVTCSAEGLSSDVAHCEPWRNTCLLPADDTHRHERHGVMACLEYAVKQLRVGEDCGVAAGHAQSGRRTCVCTHLKPHGTSSHLHWCVFCCSTYR